MTLAPNPPVEPAPRSTAARRRPAMLLIPLTICASLSGLMTWLNIGLVDDFAWRWLTSFLSALPVMALGFALMSGYDKLLQHLLPGVGSTIHKLILAVLMALTLELLMSSVVTLRNVGWVEGYTAAWATAFVRSLPIGLAIGLLMGFVVRPLLLRASGATTVTAITPTVTTKA